MAPAVAVKKEESQAEYIARLVAENAALQAKIDKKNGTGGGIRCKVTEARPAGTKGPDDKGTTTTGAVAMYGLNRFPVTLRRKQWMRVKEYLNGAEFAAFVKENESKFIDEK